MENDPDVLRELLRLAESDLKLVKARFDAGLSTSLLVLNAERKVARIKAKLAGDRLGFARSDVEYAQKYFDEVRSKVSSGIATDADLRTAEADVRIAQIRVLRETRAQTLPSAGVGTTDGH